VQELLRRRQAVLVRKVKEAADPASWQRLRDAKPELLSGLLSHDREIPWDSVDSATLPLFGANAVDGTGDGATATTAEALLAGMLVGVELDEETLRGQERMMRHFVEAREREERERVVRERMAERRRRDRERREARERRRRQIGAVLCACCFFAVYAETVAFPPDSPVSLENGSSSGNQTAAPQSPQGGHALHCNWACLILAWLPRTFAAVLALGLCTSAILEWLCWDCWPWRRNDRVRNFVRYHRRDGRLKDAMTDPVVLVGGCTAALAAFWPALLPTEALLEFHWAVAYLVVPLCVAIVAPVGCLAVALQPIEDDLPQRSGDRLIIIAVGLWFSGFVLYMVAMGIFRGANDGYEPPAAVPAEYHCSVSWPCVQLRAAIAAIAGMVGLNMLGLYGYQLKKFFRRHFGDGDELKDVVIWLLIFVLGIGGGVLVLLWPLLLSVPYLLHGPGPLLYAVVPYTVGGGAAAWLFSTAVIAENIFSRGNARDWEVVACVCGVCVALVVGATLHALRQTLEGEAFATPVLVSVAALFGTALVGWALGLGIRRGCVRSN
jgi:hypothetical protein